LISGPIGEASRPIDRWLAALTQQLVGECRAALDAYDSPRLVRAVEAYVDDLSNWYVRASRQRFWKSVDPADKRAAYDALWYALGVKAVRLATSAEEFAEVEVMPLLKLLGPKYGRDLDVIRGLLREGEFRLDDGHVTVGDWTLEPGEFELRTRARDGFAVLDGDGFAVALDTEITPELELEGEARDLIRQ